MSVRITDNQIRVALSNYVIDPNDTDEIPEEAFATELTFDRDKDLSTVSGGTRTFTVAASGNLNGVGISVYINEPVAVNFPAGSEQINDTTITTTGMNLITFLYREDYDGSGNSKVLYIINNLTAL